MLGPVDRSLLSDIRSRLLGDESWRCFVGDGHGWICPCCATPVAAQQPTLSSLMRAILDHLELACPSWHQGAAGPGLAALREVQAGEELRFRVAGDPAFAVAGAKDAWICPGCLQAQAVGVGDQRLAGIMAHRQACAPLRAWQLHPVAEVASSVAALRGPEARHVTAAAPEQDEVQRELAQARQLQLKLMRHPPALPGYHIATYYEACTEISGDFNQFIRLEDGRLAFAQGDVSGHGVRAGLFMAMANKLVEIFASQGLEPKEMVAQMHRAMAADLGGSSFITMAYGILEPGGRGVDWVRAGHNPALVWRAATGQVESLLPSGMAVGFPAQDQFLRVLTPMRVQLHPGDIFLLYTDGITEAMDPGNVEFGDDRLLALIGRSASAGPDALVQAILAEVAAHRRGRAQLDDYSLIVIGVDA